MLTIIIAIAFIGICGALALITMKKTMIDFEDHRETPVYIVQKDKDGNDTFRPLR
ncbi:MAG: hypothetical protein J6S49_00465 [Erysipelotrichaceae bacterium]|nr:hypothetical protein [Erysipelotrichaceae bacterium]